MVTLVFKKVIIVFVLNFHDILYLLMLPSLRIPHFSQIPPLKIFLEVHPNVPPIVPTPIIVPPTPPLVVYHDHNLHQWCHLLVLQHHLLLQTSLHQHCLYQTFQLLIEKVFNLPTTLTLNMPFLLVIVVYLPPISLLSLLWILCLSLRLQVKPWLIHNGNRQSWRKWMP